MKVRLEQLLGKQVRSISNKRVGRIEEVRSELRQGDLFVTDYLIGSYAAFERLSGLMIARAILGLFGDVFKTGYRVPWNRLDLSDPEKPRLTCRLSQLRKLE